MGVTWVILTADDHDNYMSVEIVRKEGRTKKGKSLLAGISETPVAVALHLLILGSCYTAHKRMHCEYNESVHQKEQHSSGIYTIP